MDKNEKWLSICYRWFGGAILCFFGFIPGWIFVQTISTLVSSPAKIDWRALLVLIGAAAMTYFFALLAYRAFTGRGRKQDGGLLPPWAMKGFIHTFGVFAVVIIIFGIYQKEWHPIVGGFGYLVIAYRSLLIYRWRRSIEDP